MAQATMVSILMSATFATVDDFKRISFLPFESEGFAKLALDLFQFAVDLWYGRVVGVVNGIVRIFEGEI